MPPLLYYLLLFHSFFVSRVTSSGTPGSNQYYLPNNPNYHPKSIFILAGQSNMAGRGGVPNDASPWDGIIPRECHPTPSILRLDPNLQWSPAQEPLHLGIDATKKCGIGPGIPLAHTILRNHGHNNIGVIGLVPCAVGGTNISEWSKGGRLYKRLIKRGLASVSNGGRLQALVWYQGESDTINKIDADEYKGRLEKLIDDFRNDLQSPMLPIILVAITSGNGPYIERVRQAQLAINLLNVRVVDAKGSELEPDHLHLTTPAQVHLGKELAHAFLDFLPSTTQNTNAPYSTSSSERACSLFPYKFWWIMLNTLSLDMLSLLLLAF